VPLLEGVDRTRQNISENSCNLGKKQAKIETSPKMACFWPKMAKIAKSGDLPKKVAIWGSPRPISH